MENTKLEDIDLLLLLPSTSWFFNSLSFYLSLLFYIFGLIMSIIPRFVIVVSHMTRGQIPLLVSGIVHVMLD